MYNILIYEIKFAAGESICLKGFREMRNGISNYAGCKSIAIMGGTFDPIHYGHLVTAEAVRHKFGVEKVLFVPTGNPAHKDSQFVTHHEHRYLMAVLATMTNPLFEVSRMEIDRPGKTYTIDTITELRRLCGEGVKLYFITGADAIHQIFTWKDPEKLLSLCDFVGVTRPGYKKNALFEEIDEIKKNYESKIHYMEVPSFAISSSDIRHRVRNDAPIKYFLPESVEAYIEKFRLYRHSEEKEVTFMLDLKTMQEKLQSALSVERYIHTMGVVKEAVKLADTFGTEKVREKARVAALLHDCAKDYPDEMKKRLCKEYHIPLDEIMKKNTELIHPFLGAEVAKREYLVEDEEILDAVRYHTTGKKQMSMLDKIVFIADYIEPGRKPFPEREEAKRLAYLDLDLAMKFILQSTIAYVKEKKRVLHPLSTEALEYYKNK